jgi:hypothetical protein
MNSKKAKLLIACVAISGLLVTGNQAFAVYGALDAVPAATLLLPYFEVGLENSDSDLVTLFSINNASAAPQLAHITLWTQASRPTLTFDVYLTGYDVITSNLGSLFAMGRLPPTLLPSNGMMGDDKIDTEGPLSVPPTTEFMTTLGLCGAMPLPDKLPDAYLQFIRHAHTGLPIPAGFTQTGMCATFDQGISDPADGIARGYITVDNVKTCSTYNATSGADYFGDTDGVTKNGGTVESAADANVLWGDYFLVDPTGNFAQGDTLVHIEADGVTTADSYTFYGRYLTPEYSGDDSVFLGLDSREALPTTWAYRYSEGDAGPFTEGTDVLCWRDSAEREPPKFDAQGVMIAEAGEIGAYLKPPGEDMKDEGLCVGFSKLGQDQVVIFDEDEDAVTITMTDDVFSPVPDTTVAPNLVCPWGTQRVGVAEFADTFPFGWMRLNLNVNGNMTLQSHVSVIHTASGLFSVGYQAIGLDNANDMDHKSVCLGSDELDEACMMMMVSGN